MTDLLFLYNESFARAFVAYRSLWFYMDDVEQSEINVNHDCDNLIVSLTRLFDRIGALGSWRRCMAIDTGSPDDR